MNKEHPWAMDEELLADERRRMDHESDLFKEIARSRSEATIERDAEAQRIIDTVELFNGPEVSL